jgi:hypothetical protein
VPTVEPSLSTMSGPNCDAIDSMIEAMHDLLSDQVRRNARHIAGSARCGL